MAWDPAAGAWHCFVRCQLWSQASRQRGASAIHQRSWGLHSTGRRSQCCMRMTVSIQSFTQAGACSTLSKAGQTGSKIERCPRAKLHVLCSRGTGCTLSSSAGEDCHKQSMQCHCGGRPRSWLWTHLLSITISERQTDLTAHPTSQHVPRSCGGSTPVLKTASIALCPPEAPEAPPASAATGCLRWACCWQQAPPRSGRLPTLH